MHGRSTCFTLGAALILLGGCGSDASDTSTTTTEAGPTPDQLAFCESHIATETAVRAAFADGAPASAEQALEAQLTEWEERAPEDQRPDVDAQVEILRESLSTGDTSFLDQGSDYRQANDRVDEFLVAHCPADVAEVSATEYAYEGLPAELPTNVPLGFVFTNDGDEVHELVLLRLEDGEEPEDALALPFDEQQRREDDSGTSLLRDPDGTDSHVVHLEAGRYVAACFIPVGTTAPDSLGDGPSHAEEGMLAEFTVG